MVHPTRRARLVLLAAALATTAGVLVAQPQPVATMFRDDLKREQALAQSFQPIELAAAGAASTPLNLYLSAGDLERAFDRAQYRPDAAIIPTNTGLVLTAATPATQRVLVSRVSKHAAVMADLQDQIAARRKQSPAGGDVLQIGVDFFLARLPRSGGDGRVSFPRMACLVASDFATGSAIDRRDLYAQDRVRKGIAGCLSELDRAGASSVIMPLLGSASARTQSKDPVFEGQRRLQECRQINAAAGIALGIHDFAPTRRAIREIGIVQWDQEITAMFGGGGRFGQAAYRVYAEQVKAAVNKGLAGEKTTAADVDGSCAATFGAAGPGGLR